jgi:phospholipid/cholesterol/gamma-HCH transport system substrate-binding protein
MKRKRRELGLHPAVWTMISIAFIVAIVMVTVLSFNRDFTSYAKVTLTSDRAGLVMEPGAKVKFRGVDIGRVSSIQPNDPVKLRLELRSSQLKYIPANVRAKITATTALGAKYVDLFPPNHPSPKRLATGAVLASQNVSIEVNTVFENIMGVLNQIDTVKLNAVLAALAEGFRGKGEALGQATTDLNEVLMAINPRSETIRTDFRALQGFSDALSGAAPDLVTVLDALSTTSVTITDNAKALDSLLTGLVGLSDSGVALLGPSKDNLVHLIDVLEPTTRLLRKYNPILTCTLVGGKNVLDFGFTKIAGGGNGKSAVVDAGLLFGDDAYRYPDNLPITGIKGGPGGVPSCGSLPDVSKNWPVRYLVTNSGWGTGLDVRPNPGKGYPGYADYFPVTRGTPESPSYRHLGPPGPGPAPYPGPGPGPIRYPGAPPYGAQQYAPDGTPLYPGLPPAPPPGRPREPGPPPPGSEPLVPPYPGGIQPTAPKGPPFPGAPAIPPPPG